MSGAIPPLPHYAFMAWCLVKAQGQLYLYGESGGWSELLPAALSSLFEIKTFRNIFGKH
jgi:hypothetical protein